MPWIMCIEKKDTLATQSIDYSVIQDYIKYLPLKIQISCNVFKSLIIS